MVLQYVFLHDVGGKTLFTVVTLTVQCNESLGKRNIWSVSKTPVS